MPLLNAGSPFTVLPFVAATRSPLPAPSRSSPRTFELNSSQIKRINDAKVVQWNPACFGV
ncbi:hypothetical protein E2C01_004729 [Portunus trituberculatus]|uniref:Uncharacterized protein n=1 Tax=Portunus trituberculatus TaxID=210409 RepID=A0A5B7CQS2_PORTR|nr:hypothetical protein [Portunus trituberculatus]